MGGNLSLKTFFENFNFNFIYNIAIKNDDYIKCIKFIKVDCICSVKEKHLV